MKPLHQKTKKVSYLHSILIGCYSILILVILLAGTLGQDYTNAQSYDGLLLSCGSMSHQKETNTSYNLSLYVHNQSSKTYYPSNNYINGTYFDSQFKINNGLWSGKTSLKSTSGTNGSVPPGGNALFATSTPITVSEGNSYSIAWQIRDVNFNTILHCVYNFSIPATAKEPNKPPSSSGGSTTSPIPTPSKTSPTLVQSPSQSITRDPSASSGSMNTTDVMTKLSKPEVPIFFTANPTKGSNLVALKWQMPGTDGSLSYLLERSIDEKSWDILANDYPSTEYTDMTTDFSMTYYYRLTVVDAKGNKSEAIHANVTTDSFVPNSGTDSDITLKSEDGRFIAHIPADSLERPANCNILKRVGLFSFSDGVRLVDGPYSISCQEEGSQYVSRFVQPIDVEYELSNEALGMQAVSLQTFHTIDSVQTDSKALLNTKDIGKKLKIDSMETSYIVVGKLKQTPLWVSLIISFVTLIGIGIGIVFSIRKYQEYTETRRTQKIAEDYWHKEKGL